MTRPRSRPKTVALRSVTGSPRIVSVANLPGTPRPPVDEPTPVADALPSIDEVTGGSPEGRAVPESEVAVAAPAAAPPLPAAPSSTNDADLPFIRYLVKAREARGLSLDDVAHMTKIRRAIIEAVETDARRDLPEKVFVLGYVRSYAAAVGMPLDETVRRFHAAWADEDEPAPQDLPARKGPSLAWVPVTLAAAVFAGVVWLVVHF
jgi:hypothetical protein